jgi:hypothetical protein
MQTPSTDGRKLEEPAVNTSMNTSVTSQGTSLAQRINMCISKVLASKEEQDTVELKCLLGELN